MSFSVRIDKKVRKELDRIPQKDRDRIATVIDALGENPFSGDIQKIKDTGEAWRRRVGNYRIFYKIISAKREILVFHVERRTTTTY